MYAHLLPIQIWLSPTQYNIPVSGMLRVGKSTGQGCFWIPDQACLNCLWSAKPNQIYIWQFFVCCLSWAEKKEASEIVGRVWYIRVWYIWWAVFILMNCWLSKFIAQHLGFITIGKRCSVFPYPLSCKHDNKSYNVRVIGQKEGESKMWLHQS